jgi:hypothetical protein
LDSKEIEIEDLALKTKDKIFEDLKEVPLGTSQVEINNTKEYWKRQIDFAVTNYVAPKGNSLESSLWAPNENTCENSGVFKAKIAAITLPGNNREERIKFVKGTLPKNKHISRVEECFTKGNNWIIINFDCLKGVNLLKERIKVKKIE